ncbi:Arylsulfatase I [Pelomyxa schiedti]|nr:Arylsulfatase I [Pelomyxa schiedti]
MSSVRVGSVAALRATARLVYLAVVAIALLIMGSECASSTSASKTQRPHIVFVLADDVGWNDIGYNQEMNVTTNFVIQTPFLDSLAREGVILENYYTQPLCSPSRSALMTGRLPFHTGIGPMIINLDKGYGLPPGEHTLAESLKDAGYATHIVGKWHLGFCDTRYLPTARGFDTWFGYSGCQQDYYTHYSSDVNPFIPTSLTVGYDLHNTTSETMASDGSTLVWPSSTYNMTYAPLLHFSEAVRIVKTHAETSKNTPLFLFLPLQSVHAPLQVPSKYMSLYQSMTSPSRKVYAGMTTCMDEGIGNVTNALKEVGLWNNTVFIFASDNGGAPWAGGNNYPLRGFKNSNWEGGVRVPAFISGGGANISKSLIGSKIHNLMHVTDWYPTVVEIAGSKPHENPLDGMSQLASITRGAPSPRTSVIINLSPANATQYYGAIIVGDWKLIIESSYFGSWAQNGTIQRPPASWNDPPTVPPPPGSYHGTWLFNIKDDPYETLNLASINTTKYDDLMRQFSELQSDPSVVPDLNTLYPTDNVSNPAGNPYDAWLPWSDLPNSTCTAWSEYDSGGIDEFVIKMTVVVAVGCILLSAGIAGAIALWINRNRFRRIMSTNKPGEGIALMSPPEHP